MCRWDTGIALTYIHRHYPNAPTRVMASTDHAQAQVFLDGKWRSVSVKGIKRIVFKRDQFTNTPTPISEDEYFRYLYYHWRAKP
jgi:hypothetical protein